jgi:hypothetical protein
MLGEKQLLIAPNTEHYMVTGVWDIISSITTYMRSVMMGIEKRPSFTYFHNDTTGALSVTIPKDQEQPIMVALRHA